MGAALLAATMLVRHHSWTDNAPLAHPKSNPVCNSDTTAQRTVSFKRDVLPILQENCVMCHQDSLPMGALDLMPRIAYAALVGVRSSEIKMLRVAPGNPEQSYLFHKIAGSNALIGGNGNSMPLGQPPLSKEDVGIVGRWIAQGAKDN
jgi:hypothetical protein